MPKIRRRNLRNALLQHLFDRAEQREISTAQLTLFANWLAEDPEVPAGIWFKRFPELTVCGEGELIKTFLRIGQIADGEEVV